MSTAITQSSYGYWVAADANVHPVPQAEEHGGFALRLLGDAFEKALAVKWVLVSVYATSGQFCFEPNLRQSLSSIWMHALRELKKLHGLRHHDEVKQGMVEGIRPRWANRFPARRAFRKVAKTI